MIKKLIGITFSTLATICFNSTLFGYQWEKIDWQIISSGLSTLELEAIECDDVCKVNEDTFYKIVNNIGLGKSDVKKTTDGGKTWNIVYSETNQPGYTPITQVNAIGTDIYVCGHFYNTYSGSVSGFIVKSGDGGGTWETIWSPGGYG